MRARTRGRRGAGELRPHQVKANLDSAPSKTASGERANPTGLTAAHRTLASDTHVRVTNRRNGRSVTVRINDRGPCVRGRVLDVTPAGARALGFSGLAPVKVDLAQN